MTGFTIAGVKAAVFLEEKILKSRGAAYAAANTVFVFPNRLYCYENRLANAKFDLVFQS